MSNQNLIYRNANVADTTSIIALVRAAYQDYRSVLTSQNWQKMETNLSDESQFTDLMSRATTFVCTVTGQLAGVIFLIPGGNPTRIFSADWCYVRLLGVDPAYRGLGIGRRLMELCIEQARSSGEMTLALHTGEFMTTARSMYERLGFKPVNELEPMYGQRYWLYKLSLTTD